MTVLSMHYLGWLELILSIGSSAYICYLFKVMKTTDSKENLKFTYISVPVCILLSIVFHPGFFDEGYDFPSMMIACGVSFCI